MNYGLQISAMGATTAMAKQDAMAHNLANINTTAFKPSTVFTLQRDPVTIEDGVGHLPSNRLLERLGGGVHLAPFRLGFKQGPIEQTGNPLDVAIEGDGFLVVRAGGDDEGAQLRLSRDGRLTRDPTGRLVRASDGRPVLDTEGRVIRLPDTGAVGIDRTGRISVGDRPVARLDLVNVPNPAMLSPEEGGLYRADSSTLENRTPAGGVIHQGAIEGSAVNEIRAIMSVTGAGRTAQANLGMIDYHDRVLDRAINRLGQVGN